MPQKMQYKTKQLEELLSYLETVPGKHITVADICLHFEQMGMHIGTTTVYRQLENMVDKGLVNKYIIDGTNAACFSYIDPEENCHRPVCYHCKCDRCGKLIHLECEEVAQLQEHMREHHGFTINPMRTVFYGLCRECAEKEAG